MFKEEFIAPVVLETLKNGNNLGIYYLVNCINCTIV